MGKKILYILNDSTRRFTYERIAGLQDAIEKAEEDITLFIMRSEGHVCFSPEHNCGEYNIFRLPDYKDFDGILLDINSNSRTNGNEYSTKGASYAVKAAVASGKPVICMANDIEGCYYVGINNLDAMSSVIRYLHQEKGLTDFWFAMGPQDNYESQTRAKALRGYCMENGLYCGEDRFYAESFGIECGRHAFEYFYRIHGGVLPQAVICGNDMIAMGICQSCKEAGISIPEQLMVTGFDNQSISGYLKPSITTIDQLSDTMGITCIDTLCRIWKGEDVPRVINTPTELVRRESTGDGEETDLRKRIEEIITADSSISSFTYELNMLQYRLPGCDSLEDICKALADCVYTAGCKGIQLVLDGSLFDFSEADPKIVEGYSNRMEIVYSWSKGAPPQLTRKEPAFSSFEDYHERENYLFVPLHFMQYTVGYLVLWNCVEMVRIRCLSSIANTLTMTLRSYFSQKKLSYYNKMLSGMSMKDDLTGLYNRFGYHTLAYNLYRKMNESGKKLGVIFIDIDFLKQLNDNYGHTAGDRAIAGVGKAIAHCMPENAISVRYGGDEFLVLVPADEDIEVKVLIEGVRSFSGTEVSTGFVLTNPNDKRSLEDYVAEADRRMYSEKSERHRKAAEH